MFTKSHIKIMCIVAWLHRELARVEIESRNGKAGEIIVGNTEYVRINGNLILNYWHKKGWTYKNLIPLQKRIKKIKDYYNSLDSSINKIISLHKDTDLNNNWIPMYLILAIAKKFKDEKTEIIPSYIDIEELIRNFTESDKVDKKTKLVYWKLARKILEDMRNVK